jgi:hypothetical protein
MADVLIVCVREDEPQAKALAEMFEAAGFTIGGAPNSDGALRSSGAGVIVWSQASIRSRPFLDAAQRVINADKAVVASLIEPPPPSSIGSSPAFDLSRWSGDPNDPSLDPLFFAVDRMVNAARASVGAGAPAPQSQFDEPPRLAPRAAPPPAPPQRLAPQPQQADPLGGEAEHWRAIRDSRDPSVFMDYLARYGATGTFSEVAELRLKQLTSARAAPQQAPPQQRREPPPPPTPRYAEAPRRAAAPPPERHYDRDDLRDPPRNQGGALRAFILVALLGGAALAGGLYFGGGLNNEASPPAVERDTQTANAGAPPDAESTFGATDNGTSFSEAQDNRPTPAQRPTAAAPDREQTRERDRERQREREAAASEPVPAPTTNFASNSGGPVSLSASNPTPPGATSNPATLSPPVTAPASTPASNTPPPAATPTRPPGTVVFTQRPSPNRIAELYPSAASRRGVGGRVELNCQVRSNLTLACSIASENPPGTGFGAAALSTVSSYRVRPTLSDGASAVGASTRIAVNFQAPQ